MLLSNVALRNRTTVGVLIVIIVVAGTISYVTLPREAAPDIPIPWVLVTTVYEGVSPEDIETSVTMKIEQKLTGISGIKEIRSTSREGLSLIQVEFFPDVDIDDALQRVRDKVDQAVPDLPTGAEEPSLAELNIAEFPIMMINISGSISPVRLKAIAENLEDYIEQVPGVLECDVLGTLEREIRLEIDPDRLAAYRISVAELMALVPGENVNISAGGLETAGTRFNVRVPAEFADPGDIDTLLLTVRDGRPIYLRDVATVRDTFKDRETISRLNGRPSITMTVTKRIGANILDIADRVNAILAEAAKRMPEGVRVDLTFDESKNIRMMVGDLENSILSGLVLVVLVLMFAMGLRTSLIVGMAIPLSMLMSFAVIQAMGLTLNLVVLFSLTLSLGMLVDNAIVIVENIYRFMQDGHPKLVAARKATAEVAWPVIASTATTVAAFAPLIMWQGIMGEFMKYLPITVITVLTSSLFVALVINPVIATVLASVKGRRTQEDRPHRFIQAYRRVLHLALRTPGNRATTMILAVFSLIAVGILYGKFNHGVEYFPQIDPAQAIVKVRCPQGTNVYHTDMLARLVEQRIATRGEQTNLELKHVVANVGSVGGAGGFGEGAVGPHIANITLVFNDYRDRKRPSAEAVEEIRHLVADIPGAEITVEKGKEGPPTGAPITVQIAGEDFGELAPIAERAYDLIAGVPGVVNLHSDYEATRPELQFISDRRRAMLLNVSTNMIGQFLKTAVFGREVGIYRQFNDEYDITIRLPLAARTNIEDLFRLTVPNNDGDPVPLTSLGRFEYRGGFGDINRIDQKRVISLTADVEGRLSEEALKDVQQLLAGLDLPLGVTLTYAGESEEQAEAMAFLGKAYLIAILAILLILVTQFNTLGIPGIILMTVLLSLVGVGAGLLITGTPFNVIMTGIGVVSLAGVVVNNAIVLLDYTRRLERRGLDILAAAVQAGMTRLRPVLLTAITTILGLIPMATGVAFDFRALKLVTRSETSQWWAPMATAVIFGLGFATVLTLIVVPTMYVSIYSALEHFGLGGLRRPSEEPAETA